MSVFDYSSNAGQQILKKVATTNATLEADMSKRVAFKQVSNYSSERDTRKEKKKVSVLVEREREREERKLEQMKTEDR